MVKYSRKHCKKGRNKSRGRRMRGGNFLFEETEAPVGTGTGTEAPVGTGTEAPSIFDSIKDAATNTLKDATDQVKDQQSKLSEEFKVVANNGSGLVGDAKSTASGWFGTVPVVPGQGPAVPAATAEKPWYSGGKRHMKGGQKFGLNYYATPVTDIKMAEPTYMENYKGGRRRRSRKRRSCNKRHRHCRKTCRKGHRHCKR